eukprot:397035_1
MDLINTYLIDKDVEPKHLNMVDEWYKNNGYDSDAIEQDVEDYKSGSNFYQYLKQNNIEVYFDLIYNKFFKSNSGGSSSTINSINFGVSVLEWLFYYENPTFMNLKEEILNNSHSTIDLELYEHYVKECRLKI